MPGSVLKAEVAQTVPRRETSSRDERMTNRGLTTLNREARLRRVRMGASARWDFAEQAGNAPNSAPSSADEASASVADRLSALNGCDAGTYRADLRQMMPTQPIRPMLTYRYGTHSQSRPGIRRGDVYLLRTRLACRNLACSHSRRSPAPHLGGHVRILSVLPGTWRRSGLHGTRRPNLA